MPPISICSRPGIRSCRRNCSLFDVNQDGEANDADLAFWINSIKETLPGDATLDGTVQFDDFLRLSRDFGGQGGWAQGNFNTDLEIDFPDFLILSRNFGLSAGDPGVDTGMGAATASAVPEPVGQLAWRTRNGRRTGFATSPLGETSKQATPVCVAVSSESGSVIDHSALVLRLLSKWKCCVNILIRFATMCRSNQDSVYAQEARRCITYPPLAMSAWGLS